MPAPGAPPQGAAAPAPPPPTPADAAAADAPPPAPLRATPSRPVPVADSGPIQLRHLRARELAAVLELVNADQSPGQPRATGETLQMALRGESPIDSPWWQQLTDVQVVVAIRSARVVGAASYAVSAGDRSGWLLWLHAREERPVVEALVDRVTAELAGSSHLYAFWIATPLTLGLESLPTRRRPVTHAVLQARGLVGRDSWRYLVAPLERPDGDGAHEEIATVTPVSTAGEVLSWRLTVGDPDRPMASAAVALGREGCGALWWIEVEPAQRRRGMGRLLLVQSLRFLARRGARTVAALVDHDTALEAERRPALRLFASLGFEEADELWSYESRRRRFWR